MGAGMRFAIPGEDATRAPDYKMVFSTKFKTLPVIHADRVILGEGGFNDIDIYTHDLGFIPMFLVFDYTLSTGTTTLANNNLNGIRVDEHKIYSAGIDPAPRTIYYILFNIDLRKRFVSDPSEAGKTESSDVDRLSEHGVKFAESRKSTESRDFRDYTIHSGARSPMIASLTQHKKSSGFITDTVSARISHGLGYAPTFFVYGVPTNPSESGYLFYPLQATSGFGVRVQSNSKEVIVKDTSNAARDFSVVVMKDPL